MEKPIFDDCDFYDTCDPIDYEKYLNDNEQNFSNNIRALFPENDIEVIELEKQVETIEHLKPELEAEIDPHVNDCLRSYNSNYIYLRRNFEQLNITNLCASNHLEETNFNAENQRYEIDTPNHEQNSCPVDSDFDKVEPDSIIPNLLDTLKIEEDEKNNEAMRSKDRISSLFVFYNGDSAANKNKDKDSETERCFIDHNKKVEMPQEAKKNSILVKCISLKFDLEVEPIFATMALYDLKERKKISENFYFDFNIEQLKNMIKKHNRTEDVSTTSQSCIFNITYPSSDIYLIVRLEKVLQQGEISECAEPYLKYQQMQNTNDKANFKEKQHYASQQYCERLGRYRMPFAWTAINLMNILNVNLSENSEDLLINNSLFNLNLNNNNTNNNNHQNKTSSLDRSEEYNLKSFQDSYRKQNSQQSNNKMTSYDDSVIMSQNKKFMANEPEIDAEASLRSKLSTFKPISISINNFFKQDHEKLSDEDLYRILTELKKSPNLIKKFKLISGTLKMVFAPFVKTFDPSSSSKHSHSFILNMSNNLILDHNLKKLKYKSDFYNLNSSTKHVSVIKNLLEFPSKSLLVPNFDYRNLLYIYPTSVNFSNRQGISARNIAVKVNFMKSEGEHCALPVIFGKSNTSEFCKEIYFNVVYHNKTPQFYDEVKINLPALLSGSNYHLLFTFYHISCNGQKDESQIETCIGHTWLPLNQQDNRVVGTGTYCLPIVFDKLSPGYSNINPGLSENQSTGGSGSNGMSVASSTASFMTNNSNSVSAASSNLTLISGQTVNSLAMAGNKCYFEFKLNLQSTIHTQDEYLDRFIMLSNNILMNFDMMGSSSCDEQLDTMILKVLNEVYLASLESIIKYLFILLDKLFNLMMKYQANISQACFEAIVKIVNKVTNAMSNENDSNNRNKYLLQYILYASNLPYKTNNYNAYERNMMSNEIFLSNRSASKRFFHEELLVQIMHACQSLKSVLYTNIWFFLDLLFKSTGLYLLSQNIHANISPSKAQQGLHMSFPSKSRKEYFKNNVYLSKRYLDDSQSLVKIIIKEILGSLNSSSSLQINNYLAYFLNSCFSILDRSFVLQLVSCYFQETNKAAKLVYHKIISQSTNNSTLMKLANAELSNIYLFKLNFLKLLCNHEHYILLNLPFFLDKTGNLLNESDCDGNLLMNELRNNSIFFRKHYLVGLLLQIFNEVFSLNTQMQAINQQKAIALNGKLGQSTTSTNLFTHTSNNLQISMIDFLKDLIKAHDMDLRYHKNKLMRSNISILYFPFLKLTLKLVPELYRKYIHKKVFNKQEQRLLDKAYLVIDNELLGCERIINENSQNNCSKSSENLATPSNSKKKSSSIRLNEASLKNLAMSSLWILKNLGSNLLFQLISDWSADQIIKLIQFLDLCILNFEYKGKQMITRAKKLNSISNISIKNNILNKASGTTNRNKFFKKANSNVIKTKLENVIIGNQNARTEFLKRRKSSHYHNDHHSDDSDDNQKSQSVLVNESNDDMLLSDNSFIEARNDEKTLRWNKYLTNYRQSRVNLNYETSEEVDKEAFEESNLATECVFIALDTIEVIIKVIKYQQRLRTASHSYSMITTNIFKFILNALNLNQSVSSLCCLFSHQRILLMRFPELLFEMDMEYCSDICTCLLRHCTSSIDLIRSQASSSLYALMRQNFDIGNNFSKVKMQITMSLSRLVGQRSVEIYFNESYLKKSLKTVMTYAESDVELCETTFPSQVKDLVCNLNMILCDTVKMKDYVGDNEMLIDLMHRIANCYQNNPDLRLIWLQNIAQKHLQSGFLVEAGQCLIHAAALVAEYIGMMESKPYLPVGCTDFKKVNINVLEESAVSDDIVSSSEDGICTTKYFSESGLIGLIEQSVVFLMHSQHYEVVSELYKILVPIYESHHDYKKLSQVHSKLHDCYNKIMLHGMKRLFGTYFRVGFYGRLFEELDGEEFIYKEPGITKLSEIASRLEAFYKEKYGNGAVEIMKDSNNVDRNTLDLNNKVYIQITYVEPYFDRCELRKCLTNFEKNYSIKRFIYSTPFTLEGKAHGSLRDQYKRKTILTTERAFPYLKTRIPVIDKSQIVLTPVEVAIEDLQKKIDELKLATNQEPIDPKMLQMVLQGCVGTTVNQGPLEMALTFLQPRDNEVFTEHHNKLRICFKEFSRRCADALEKNSYLIGLDQKEYQKEMEKNYLELKSKIEPLIENRILNN